MECRKYQLEISLLIDGELNESSAANLNEHVRTCPECRAAYEETEALNGRLKNAGLPLPPPALARKVKERLAGETSVADERALFPQWVRVPLIAVIVLLAIGIGNLAGRQMTEIIYVAQTDEQLEQLLPEGGPVLAGLLTEMTYEEDTQ
ncbi:anti-sigma factor family protein [Thermodesulfobacteriota bacterium]